MTDVLIDKDKLNDAKQDANSIKNSVKRTEQYCETLLSITSSSSWKGKSKDAFLTYLEIIVQYHHDLSEAVDLQKEALQNLEQYIGEFPQDSRVSKVRNI